MWRQTKKTLVWVGLAACLAACGDEASDDDDDGSSSSKLGDPCPQDGWETCEGDNVLQCNLVGGNLEWTFKKNCKDTDRHCEQVTTDDADCTS